MFWGVVVIVETTGSVVVVVAVSSAVLVPASLLSCPPQEMTQKITTACKDIERKVEGFIMKDLNKDLKK
jgi:hypothetical protein